MRGLSALLAVLCTAGLAAQTPAPGDRFYAAIRENDLVTLRTLIRDAGADARDARNQTPLMMAAAVGSVDAMRTLLTSGSDPRASDGGGVTALHLTADSLAKTRLLIDAGADVNVATQLGRTPLLVAASVSNGADVVRLLLAKGARVNVADTAGVSPLIAAANADNRAAAEMLLAAGANPHASAQTGQPSTPLMAAAINGNLALVRLLLARRPDLGATSVDRTGTVKNGPVRYGGITALHAAVTGGNRDVVELLLKAGAPVDATDTRGMTPLMWAIATDRANPLIVRTLLAHGADVSVRAPSGGTASEWARRFNHPAVMAALGLVPVTNTAAVAPVPSHAPASARDAVLRSLPLQRAVSARVAADGGCTAACHAQPLTALAIDAARARGWTTTTSEVEAGQVPALLNAFATNLNQFWEQGGTPDGLVYAGLVMAEQHAPAAHGTDVMVRYLAAKQRAAGNWRGIGATRAPMQDGDFSRTALAIRVMLHYAPPALRGEYREHVTRAANWLASEPPLTTEDRVMQLLGLTWADAHAAVRRTRTRELLQLQRADGGWSQTPHLTSDAYATGQVLYTLRTLGVADTEPAMQRATAFLLRTQQEDGSWHVTSRAMKIQPYFESGMPYGHDQWISHAATAWASIGLAR